jgi:ATP adenylyltransferase
LVKKPTPSKEHDNAAPKRPKVNPFENPDPQLFITDIPNSHSPTHFLILNKFPIIKHHFILATKKHKEQTRVLEEDDVAATYAVLKAWRSDGVGEENGGRGKRLFCFFNSGKHSGASQAHRHLQFLPEESVREGTGPDVWSLLIDRITEGAEEGRDTVIPPLQ